jgi:hypothetical protein
MAYLLADLKTNGVMLSQHMITGVKVIGIKPSSNNATNTSSNASTSPTEDYTIDISDCPVFDGSFKVEYPKRYKKNLNFHRFPLARRSIVMDNRKAKIFTWCVITNYA